MLFFHAQLFFLLSWNANPLAFSILIQEPSFSYNPALQILAFSYSLYLMFFPSLLINQTPSMNILLSRLLTLQASSMLLADCETISLSIPSTVIISPCTETLA